MSVLQPLYFAGGRYTAGTDRKLFSALYAATSAGDRRTGVIPSVEGTKSMKVSTNVGNLKLTVNTGLCVIPDSQTQSADSPGLYLCGVDTNTETVTVPAGGGSDRYDLIYAVVDETSYVITNKVLTTNVATLTTSSAHGFSVDQTVVISGVDDVFDGSYVITDVPTNTTFKYSRTHANVASTVVTPTASKGSTSAVITFKALATTGVTTLTTASAHGFSVGDLVTIKGLDSILDGTYQLETGTTGSTLVYNVNRVIVDAITSVATPNSAVARARVPFSIRVQQGNTNPNPTLSLTGNESGGIPLAVVYTAASFAGVYTSGNITDVREFVGLSGAVQIYNGNSAAAPGTTNPTSGMLRYNTNTNTLEIYDSTAVAWNTLYSNSTSGEIFSRATHTHAIYSLATHVHTTSPTFANFTYSSNCFTADGSVSGTPQISSSSSSSPTQIGTAITYDTTAGYTTGAATIPCLITGHVTLILEGGTTETVTYIGVDVNATGTTDDYAFATYSSVSNSYTSSSQLRRVTVPFTRVVDFEVAGNHTITLSGYRSNTSNTAQVYSYYLTVVPIRAY
jgi:hypothetical protein